ncbi:MAG TPA: 3-deoxy-D-manno-octulosonic acid transferase [Pyrinomonadaceae bacterium]|nr:3-deoxy-D-manno-octulosonic acid transferase [Pyrinomonadaceae bacterium]
MFLLYSLLLTLGILALLPVFLWRALRHGKYVEGLRERAGVVGKIEAGGRPVVWLHCVSVGETQAARPLARALVERFPSHALVVSTTTLTGQRVAREAFRGLAASVFYFPFDWAWSVRRALRAVNPSVVLMMETELWPRFFRECGRRGVSVALVNGRISEKSFGRYQLIRPFIRRVLSDLSLAAAQTEGDAARLVALGLAPGRTRVTGNVKFDIEEAPAAPLTEELRRRFRIDKGRPLVVAASTHAPEERVLLEALGLLRPTTTRRTRLLVAPRHPERFGEVAALLEASGLTWARRTDEPRESDAACDVILLDSIGELRAVYPLAEVVFVGGSIAPVGGHNVLEPALDARAVVTGPYTSNFKSIVAALLERDALIQLPPSGQLVDAPPSASGSWEGALGKALRGLLRDGARRRGMGERARAVLEENRGATARTVELLAPLLRQRPEVRGQRPVEETALTSGL